MLFGQRSDDDGEGQNNIPLQHMTETVQEEPLPTSLAS
jgi:hypothetical protein